MNYELLGKVMTLVLNDDYYEKAQFGEQELYFECSEAQQMFDLGKF